MRAEGGQDVAFDLVPVAAVGAGGQGQLLAGQPLPRQVGTEGQRAGLVVTAVELCCAMPPIPTTPTTSRAPTGSSPSSSPRPAPDSAHSERSADAFSMPRVEHVVGERPVSQRARGGCRVPISSANRLRVVAPRRLGVVGGQAGSDLVGDGQQAFGEGLFRGDRAAADLVEQGGRRAAVARAGRSSPISISRSPSGSSSPTNSKRPVAATPRATRSPSAPWARQA